MNCCRHSPLFAYCYLSFKIVQSTISIHVYLVVDCGHPGTWINALPITLLEGTTLYNSQALLACKSGFWVAGVFKRSLVLTCDEQGLWRPLAEDVHCVGMTFQYWNLNLYYFLYINQNRQCSLI